jgi:aldehyde dehydrogenase (NAD+)
MATAALDQSTARTTPTEAVAQLRKHFNAGLTRPLDYRREQLHQIGRFLNEQEPALLAALESDMRRPSFEGYQAEVGFAAKEVSLTFRNLARWASPERVPTTLLAQPGKSFIQREPLGVVLIIGAWNYPLQLVIVPLIGAIAAGNCAVVKPSEIAPAMSELIAAKLPEYLDTNCVQIVTGGIPETTALLAEQFDHIFYTGNGTVGRIVMEAAAKHLTPVTLELGGKCPVIVDEHTDLAVTARRIIWGKLFNAGQTCVAPDYVLAHHAVERPLLDGMKQALKEFLGDDPKKSADLGRIINERHFRRLTGLLPGSGDVFVGGTGDEAERYIAPTILHNVPEDAPVMADEIFGPILPVLTVRSIDEAIAFVNARPKPLALYLFSDDAAIQKSVLDRTSSGGVTVNHTLFHLTIPALPFGGVGNSGMGAYHGRASFETFSHRKSVLVKRSWPDPGAFYPPYSETVKRLIRRLF